MSQQHDFHLMEDRFRDELREASVIPPIAVWEKIDAGLPKAVPFYVRYKWPMIASALIGVVLAGSIWSLQSNDEARLSAFKVHPSAFSVVSSVSDAESVKQYASNSAGDQLTASTSKRQGESSSDDQVLVSAASLRPKVQSSNTSTSSWGNKQLSSPKSIDQKSSLNNRASLAGQSVGSDYLPSDKVSTISDNGFVANMQQSMKAVSSENMLAEGFSADDTYRPKAIPVEPFTYSDDELLQLSARNAGNKKGHKHINVNSGFFMGPVFGYQFNRLTKQTSSPETDNSFLEYRPHFGSHYGLAFGYDFPSRWGILAEWVYSSNEGQRFQENFGDYVVNKSIELDYMKFPLMVRYQQAFLNKQGRNPVILNLMGGLQYSLLRSKNTFINDELALVDQKFNKHTWGLAAGAELDIYATKQLFFTIGMKSAFASSTSGFPRLKGREGNDPMSIQTGLYARLNYRLVPIKNKEKQPEPQTFGQ